MAKLTPEKKEKFFAELAEGQSVSAAAAAISISRNSMYAWRTKDEAFAKAWDEAIEAGTDTLEDEAVRRAKAGSDTLLIFLLNGRRPEKFKHRSELTGKNGGPVEITINRKDARAL